MPDLIEDAKWMVEFCEAFDPAALDTDYLSALSQLSGEKQCE